MLHRIFVHFQRTQFAPLTDIAVPFQPPAPQKTDKPNVPKKPVKKDPAADDNTTVPKKAGKKDPVADDKDKDKKKGRKRSPNKPVRITELT